MNRLFSVAILMLTSACFAQTAPAPKPAQPLPKEVCTTVPDATGMTGCEQAVIENIMLKNKVVQLENELLTTRQQLSSIQQEMLKNQASSVNSNFSDTIKILEAKHPGTTYSPPDETHQMGSLTKTKAPTPPAKK